MNDDPYESQHEFNSIVAKLGVTFAGRKLNTLTKDDISFVEWMAVVDRLITRKIGLGVYDLPDWPSRDTYDSGETVQEGCNYALENADYFDAEES